MGATKLASAAFIGLSLAALAAACNVDPVHSSAVQALGPEIAGVPQGEYHRAGQPCVTCHGPEGPAKQQFTIAGTIFNGPADTSPPVGVGNVTVTLMDDTLSQYNALTDCVGNFGVTADEWPGHPQFPVLVTISLGPGQQTLSMQSHIGRTGSCADCHQYPTTDNYYQTPGIVHLYAQDNPNFQGDPNCAVNPIPPGFGGP
jgi:cytochrome c553